MNHYWFSVNEFNPFHYQWIINDSLKTVWLGIDLLSSDMRISFMIAYYTWKMSQDLILLDLFYWNDEVFSKKIPATEDICFNKDLWLLLKLTIMET